jgi:hypothetical protein
MDVFMLPACVLFCAFSSSEGPMGWTENFADILARRSFYRSVLLVRIDDFLEQSSDLKDPLLKARWDSFCASIVSDASRLGLPDFPRNFAALRRAWPTAWVPSFVSMVYRSFIEQQLVHAPETSFGMQDDIVLCYEARGPLSSFSVHAEEMKVFPVAPEDFSSSEHLRYFMEKSHHWRHAAAVLAEQGLLS